MLQVSYAQQRFVQEGNNLQSKKSLQIINEALKTSTNPQPATIGLEARDGIESDPHIMETQC